jgi:transposase
MHYLGIDVGRKESTFYVMDDHGERVRKGRIESSGEAVAQLIDELIALQEGVQVAIEAGNVTFTLSRAMQEHDADVFVIHPLDNAIIARSRKKTDGIDAKTLADQRRREILPPHSVYVPSEACEDLRHLVTARASLVRRRTAMTNQTLHVLARYQEYPQKRCFKRDSAWREVPLSELRDADRFIVEMLVENGLLANAQIRRIENEVETTMNRDFAREHSLLRSVPGIGPVTASSVIAWATPIKRFDSARHFASYAGLAPSTRQSGERRIDGGTARTGNRHLGATFVQAALTFTSRQGPGDELYRWYERVLRRRGWKKARVALARKLAAVAYGVLKHGERYDPRYLEALLRREAESKS